MPVALTDAVGFWTGEEVVVVGSALDTDNASVDPEGKPRAVALTAPRTECGGSMYRPLDRWAPSRPSWGPNAGKRP